MRRDVKDWFHRQKPARISGRRLGERFIDNGGCLGVFAGQGQGDGVPDRCID